MKTHHHFLNLIFISLIAINLLSCGSNHSMEQGRPFSQNSKTQLLNDETIIAERSEFKAINLTFSQAELISNATTIELFDGLKTFNLLDFSNATEIFSEVAIPEGEYQKIRLTLTEIELILKNGDKETPDLVGNNKLDLNARKSFVVAPNAKLFIQLDHRTENVIKITETGNNRFLFRPEVFVEIMTDTTGTQLVRLNGLAKNLNAINGSFDLCRFKIPKLAFSRNSDGDDGSDDDDETAGNSSFCAEISTTQEDTAFFASNGDPANFEDLVPGDKVTAIGHFSMIMPKLKPKKRHADDSGDDDASNDDDSSDGDSSDDDESNDREKIVQLDAEIVWQDNENNFHKFNGTVLSTVTTDADRGTWFKYSPVSGKYSCSELDETSIPVTIQNGTGIYDRDGNKLTLDNIQPGVPVLVDGVCGDKGETTLKSVMITLDLQENAPLQLSGVIDSVEKDFSGLTLLTESPESSKQCVILNKNIPVYEVVVENNIPSFNQKKVYDLTSGQKAVIFGDMSNRTGKKCLNADTVIYEEDENSTQPI